MEVSTGPPIRGAPGDRMNNSPQVFAAVAEIGVLRREPFHHRSNTTPTTTSPAAAQRRQRTSSFKMYFANNVSTR